MRVLEHPDRRLRAKAEPIDVFDAELRGVANAMLDAMYAAKGIGLAGPQVGLSKRIFVVDLGREEPRPEIYVNPEITWRSPERELREEGCLSIPGQYADVERPVAITMRYFDLSGDRREISADALQARCLQHEYDHLEGVLFIDHLSMIKRSMLLRKLAKARRKDD